ncbi:P-loop containing nucleoside triphosphate hydrolase protein [Catenaria anguillulae PL171]|uniref:p-loop containing nucleoside triphosphate hydrolase protein n=1 Tax=Catenaria anguillulae PL171 TaxID=765915 RepID=A0A1Y2HG41_9FUNG|nr:P-loop containing nucleoside triphosphate hydrolase protein [Catenaria anguillulae PL171]
MDMDGPTSTTSTAAAAGPGPGSLKRMRDPSDHDLHHDSLQTKFSFDFNPAPPSLPAGTVPVSVAVAAPSALTSANRRESLIKPPSSFAGNTLAHVTHRETFAFSTAPTNSAFAHARSENAAPQPPPMRKLTAPPSAYAAATTSSSDPHLGPAQKKQRTATGAAPVGRSTATSTSGRFNATGGSARAAVNPPGVARRTSVASSGYGTSSSSTASTRSTLARSTTGLASASSTTRRNFTSTSSSMTRPTATAAGAASAGLASVPEDKPLRMDTSTMHALGDHIASQIASGNSEQMAQLQAQIVELQRTQLAHQETYIKAVDERVEMEGKVAKMEAQRTFVFPFLLTFTIAESDRDRLRRDLDACSSDLADTRAKLARLDADHKELQAIHADQLRVQEAERQQEMGQLRIHAQTLATERDALAARVAALEQDISLDLGTAHAALRANYESVTHQLTATTETLAERDARVLELEAKVREMEMDRRRLHNEIQELKGNIRSAAALDHLKLDDKLNAVDFVVKRNTADGRVLTEPIKYKFDKVFTPQASQAAVFDEISHLVQSALDGYNVGKTYTMEGRGLPKPGSRGMIPRAVDQIFLTAKDLREQGWEYDFCGQYVEIYNETVRDLLRATASGLRGPGAFGPGRGAAGASAAASGSAVTDPLPLTTPAERCVHAMNDRSSRSHSVFILFLRGANALTGEKCESQLFLVTWPDPSALQSRVPERSQPVEGATSINKSLTALGDVIEQLIRRGERMDKARRRRTGGDEDAYVGFRSSKLTHLLKAGLGGNAKALMFVNVSPLVESSAETKNL